MVLFKINYWIKRKRDYQFTSVWRFCGQTDYHFDSVEIAKVVLSLDLPPSKLDIGKLTYEYVENEKYPDARHFVLDKLKEARSSEEITPKTWFYMVLVIGRLLARELMSKTGKGSQLRLRAIVTRDKMMLQHLKKGFAFAL
jgi:glyceraldehyde 3-phosphate dehydrogenase